MTLFKLALLNVRNNLENYTVYFLSMAFNITIYYLFASLRFSQAVRMVVEREQELELFFNLSSVAVALFAVLSIWFSTSFFLRRRRGEVAIYGLVGMTRHQVGTLLFFETLLAGVAALLLGILFGVVMAKFFQLLLIWFLGFTGSVPFEISLDAIWRTSLIFGVLFMMVALYGYALLAQVTLGTMLHKRREAPTRSESCGCKSLWMPALLLCGYGLLPWQRGHEIIWPQLILAVLFLCQGTYAAFRYFLPCLLKRLKKQERFFHVVPFLAVNQLSVFLRSQVKLLTLVTLLGAATLIAVGLSYHIYQELLQERMAQMPFSFAYMSDDLQVDEKVRAIIDGYPQHFIEKEVDVRFLLLPLTEKDLLGWHENAELQVVSRTAFSQAAAAKELAVSLPELGPQEGIYLSYYREPEEEMPAGRELDLARAGTVLLVKHWPWPVLNESQRGPALIVSDETYAQWSQWAPSLRGKAYMVDNLRESRELTDDIYSVVPAEAQLSSFYVDFHQAVKLWGVLLFMGFFIGTIVISSSCSILSFQFLSQIQVNKDFYELLRGLGVTAEEVRLILAAQLFPCVAFSWFLAVFHAFVAFFLFGSVFQVSVLSSSLLNIGIYTVVYCGYYFLTIHSCIRGLAAE